MRRVIAESPTLEDRYWSYVDRRGPDECWPWVGASGNNSGHGKIYAGKDDHGREVREHAHRLAWRFANGAPAGNLKVRHRCDNPPCQNPRHLQLGTQADNVRDMHERGRSRHRNRAKLTDDDVREILRLHNAGLRYKDIALRFPVTHDAIRAVVSGRNWAHVERPGA